MAECLCLRSIPWSKYHYITPNQLGCEPRAVAHRGTIRYIMYKSPFSSLNPSIIPGQLVVHYLHLLLSRHAAVLRQRRCNRRDCHAKTRGDFKGVGCIHGSKSLRKEKDLLRSLAVLVAFRCSFGLLRQYPLRFSRGTALIFGYLLGFSLGYKFL